MKGAATQKEVAKAAGVTAGLVSLAMSGKGRMSTGTRERIREIAREMGYQPSLTAQKMAMRRWKNDQPMQGVNLALIHDIYKSPYYAGLEKEINFFTRLCKERGHGATLINLSEYKNKESWKKLMRVRGVEGILMGYEANINEALLRELSTEWPVVIYSPREPMGICHEVREDHPARIYRAAQMAYNKGYRRIGFVLLEHEPKIEDDYQRRGILNSLEERLSGIKVLPTLFYRAKAPTDFATTLLKVNEWYAKYEPEIVIGMNDAIYHSMRLSGISVPKMVAYLNYHLDMSADQSNYPKGGLSGFVREKARLVNAAVRLVENVIRHPLAEGELPMVQIVEPIWHEGGSMPDKTKSLMIGRGK